MYSTLLVMAGGGLGAAARYQVGSAAGRAFGLGFPWGTMIVNLSGGLLMGLLAGTLARSAGAHEPWRLLLGVGVLGGFTTFSAFSLETYGMIERGQAGLALGYALASVIGSVLALFAGILVSRAMA